MADCASTRGEKPCVRPDGHGGPHAADPHWIVAWWEPPREGCPATGEQMVCIRDAGHVGAHRWDYPPPAARGFVL